MVTFAFLPGDFVGLIFVTLAVIFLGEKMFLDSPSTPLASANPEFQAVVLAGYGSRMYPLTEESNLPKALLPIANQV